jgi:hypothetical protein
MVVQRCLTQDWCGNARKASSVTKKTHRAPNCHFSQCVPHALKHRELKEWVQSELWLARYKGWGGPPTPWGRRARGARIFLSASKTHFSQCIFNALKRRELEERGEMELCITLNLRPPRGLPRLKTGSFQTRIVSHLASPWDISHTVPAQFFKGYPHQEFEKLPMWG